ncbi:hypothetical protein HAX54_043789 [Datura stramonium]|uniref:PPM-type phosphatase domain-containing protein n=1 Tax=Datura stramonium TaxID=4076 RepID=A0ABS8W385_DATST|nr:hypothetical protein [Datura stramonium]
MKRIFMYGFFIVCAVGILMNPKVIKLKPESEVEPEEEIVAAQNATMSSVPIQNCHFASIQGRRSYQEDRVTCDLDLKIPLSGRNDGLEEVNVGVVAVFDGHIGSAASEMASRLFLDKFLQRKNYGEQSSNHMEFLKSSLVKTIEEIDAEFTKLAIEYELYSGSTAVVALIYNKKRVLVANVGDSKAFICSRKLQLLEAKELTEDHNAYRVDERARVEASGGKFKFPPNYVPLLMGHFPMTRAIGDVPLKKYGIIATPEVTDWLNLTSKDEFLVVASDGIFESLSPQEVCDFLYEAEDYSDSTFLAQQIVQKAFLEGSTDNLSVVLVPLGSK